MNLTRCNQGHFYDMDKFDSCPHCQSGGAASDKTAPLSEPIQPTSAFDGGAGDVTVPYNQSPEMGSVDVTEPGGEAYTAPAMPTTPPPTPAVTPVTPVQGYGLGKGLDSVNPFSNVAPEAATEPLSGNPFGGGVYSGQIPPTPAPYPMDLTEKSGTADLGSIVTGAMNSRFEPSDEGKTIGFYHDAMAEQKVSIDPVVGWLVCIKGDAFGKSFTLKSGKNFIGRDRKMDVALVGDKSVSRQCHAIILYDPKSKMFLVQPGTSRELFYLNDRVVLGVEAVESNDVLSIGKTDLMFIPCCSPQFCWEDQIEKINEESEK